MKNKQDAATTDAAHKLYFTSDNHAFLDEERARRHARRLKDKTINTLSLQEAENQLAAMTKVSSNDELETFLDELTNAA